MKKLYCGNNSLDPDLLAGDVILGTRYTCLKRGIGQGLYLHCDQKYIRGYEPIDKRRLYCGDKAKLPKGYYSMGNLPQCLQKGVGIGKKKKALECPSKKFRIRKSPKKSRTRKPCKSNQVRNRSTKRCRKKSTRTKSRVRKSVKKSRVRKSPKKSRKRKSPKKSRKRKSPKKSRTRKSPKKSRAKTVRKKK